MQPLSAVLKLLSLSILSAGSASIVFAAIILVKAAVASGLPVAEAARNNAPIFIQYAKPALLAAGLLALGCLLDLKNLKSSGKIGLAVLCSSVLCIVSVLIYAFAIVPPMEKLLPEIKTIAASYEQFHKLHELSRAIFGASIISAFVALLLPVFAKTRDPLNPADLKEETQASCCSH